MQEERETALKELGIALKSDGGAIGVTQQKQPHLLNLNEDPLMSELLLYYLTSEGVTRLGRGGEDIQHQDIQLGGELILPEHCTFETDGAEVKLVPIEGAGTYINGEPVTEPTLVPNGARIIFGQNHVFRFVNPKDATLTRRATGEDGPMDWAAAQRELVLKQAHAELNVDKEKHAETQSRLQDLEQKMADEKDAADQLLEVQRAEFEAKMQKVQEEQEAILAAKEAANPNSTVEYSHQERRAALRAYKRWKLFRFTSLRAELISATPMIKEANAICIELQKNVVFQFILRKGSVYFPNESNETQVMVELCNRTSGDRIAVWPLKKLSERIFDMRDFYHSRQVRDAGVDLFSWANIKSVCRHCFLARSRLIAFSCFLARPFVTALTSCSALLLYVGRCVRPMAQTRSRIDRLGSDLSEGPSSSWMACFTRLRWSISCWWSTRVLKLWARYASRLCLGRF